MAAPLGAVLDLLEANFNDIVFDKVDGGIKSILQKNGFLSYFGFDSQIDIHGTTIQYQKMKPDDGRYFREYVTAQFIKRSELPNMSSALQRKMTEAMFELFNNAKIHSETKHIYTCGQFYPKRHTIEFCIVDTGIGFKEKFKKRFKKTVSAIDAIQWSLKDKNTTKIGVSGGIGLSVLSEFVHLNQGKLQIASGNGFYQYSEGKETLKELNCSFPGSIINVLFKTNDDKNYSLSSETDETDLF
jgi:anti-sigma regulatory factor (Ser/Thr protein kinase)